MRRVINTLGVIALVLLMALAVFLFWVTPSDM